MAKKRFFILTVILLLVAGYAFYLEKGKVPAIIPSNKIILDSEGNLAQNNERKTTHEVKNSEVKNTEISYVPKKNHEKTDVEYSTQKKNIYVKVNGKTHEIKPTVKETQKFENGKLQIRQEESTSIEIKAPPRSRFTASYYQGLRGKHGLGVGYQVSKNVQINGLYIDNSPYVGVTVSIGSTE